MQLRLNTPLPAGPVVYWLNLALRPRCLPPPATPVSQRSLPVPPGSPPDPEDPLGMTSLDPPAPTPPTKAPELIHTHTNNMSKVKVTLNRGYIQVIILNMNRHSAQQIKSNLNHYLSKNMGREDE